MIATSRSRLTTARGMTSPLPESIIILTVSATERLLLTLQACRYILHCLIVTVVMSDESSRTGIVMQLSMQNPCLLQMWAFKFQDA